MFKPSPATLSHHAMIMRLVAPAITQRFIDRGKRVSKHRKDTNRLDNYVPGRDTSIRRLARYFRHHGIAPNPTLRDMRRHRAFVRLEARVGENAAYVQWSE